MQKYNKSKDRTYQNVEDGVFRKKMEAQRRGDH